MILFASKDERNLIKNLRLITDNSGESMIGLSEQVVGLKREIAQLTIDKGRIKEDHDREDRELRHMIGLEKKRQEVELVQAKKETELTIREGNLQAERKRFEEQLEFNTKRFESMEKYLKDMMSNILERLPNINVKLTGTGKR